MIPFGLPLSIVLSLVAAGPIEVDGSSLGLADLPAYRNALEAGPEDSAEPVTFRDLWDDPDRFEGQRVRVVGRVVRRFHQPAVGTYPALAEVWARDDQGNLLCLVHPEGEDRADSAPGRTIRFEGTYLKRLRYPGGDADRLAPLIVGHRPPAPTTPASPVAEPGRAASRASEVDWTFGLLMAGAVVVVLAVKHLRRPPARPVDVGPPPTFHDDSSEGDGR